MKKQQKIRRAARIVAKGYIKTLEEGLVPARLAAQIEAGKYDILHNVNDDRLNMSDTLESVRREAHGMIKDALKNAPHLADALIEARAKIEEEQARKDQEEERKANAPLARHLAKMAINR